MRADAARVHRAAQQRCQRGDGPVTPQRSGGAHKRARTHAAFQHAAAGELLYGLPQCDARDPQLSGQLPFGRQTLAGLQLSLLHQGTELFGYVV